MFQLQIPDAVVPAFDEFSRISTEEVVKIGKMMRDFPIGGGSNDLKKLIDKSELSGIIPGLTETIFSFGSLLAGYNDKSIEELVDKLATAYKEKKTEETEEDSIRLLKDNLSIIFENADSLKKTFKAFYLFRDNMNVFNESKVMTDIRLLFNDDLQEKPRCGIILHQLKIDYWVNNNPKSIFISMDKEDVMDLREALQRALDKEDIIKENHKEIQFITLQ